MKNNRLLTALRYVGDPSRDGAAQYLIATASAQEVTGVRCFRDDIGREL